jgi:hypothetical protein
MIFVFVFFCALFALSALGGKASKKVKEHNQPSKQHEQIDHGFKQFDVEKNELIIKGGKYE